MNELVELQLTEWTNSSNFPLPNLAEGMVGIKEGESCPSGLGRGKHAPCRVGSGG